MAEKKRTGYTAVSMPTPIRDQLQRAAFVASAEISRRVSLADIASAALTVAEKRPDELRKALVATLDRKGTDK